MFVKICATTSEEDALLAVAMGADAVGFVFAPSARRVRPADVAHIVKRLPPEVVTVGVFRDEAPRRVVDVMYATDLRVAQLHGHETPADARFVRERVPAVWKAFPAGDPGIPGAAAYGADAVLVDAPSPGSGQVFDWKLAADVPPGARLVLAGGLTPANVADAVAAVRPWGVDVASGVEASPGRKDPRKLRAFVAAAKAAGADAAPTYEPTGAAPYDWQDDAR